MIDEAAGPETGEIPQDKTEWETFTRRTRGYVHLTPRWMD